MLQNLTLGGALKFAFVPTMRPDWGYNRRIFTRLLALTFINAGILPRSHPAARVASITEGELSFFALLGEARRAVNWRDPWQACVFLAVVILMICGVTGFFVAMLQASLGTAYAQEAWSTLTEGQDLASKWLRGVFGITTGAPSPSDIQSALGNMLMVYNTTALGLGVFLCLYNVIVIVMESAKHGRVGGQRHSMLWAPIRLVFGMGLLVPISDGWNGGQLLTVWLAGQGSKIASTTWTAFTDQISSGRGAIVTPTVPNSERVIGTALAIETCMLAFNTVAAVSGDSPYITVNVDRRLTHPRELAIFGTQDWLSGIERAYDGTSYYPRRACGSMRFVPPENVREGGAKQMVIAHRDALMAVLPELQALARQVVQSESPNPTARQPLPSTSVVQGIVNRYNQQVISKVAAAVAAQNGEAQQVMAADAKAAGWAAAPAWFNTLSRLNGQILQAAGSMPQMVGPAMRADWPEDVRRAIVASGVYWQSTQADMGRPTFESTSAGTEEGLIDHIFAAFGFSDMVASFQMTSADPLGEMVAFGHKILNWTLAFILGMAALAGLSAGAGPAMAMGGLMGGPGGSAAGLGAYLFFGKAIAAAIGFLGPFLTVIAVSLFASGGLLTVVLPFLPLVRWMFGCVSWLLGVLEAVVAVPVMLIAHLRSDGEGLAGPMAQAGYTILLGLFLRPVLMVFALVVSLLIFNNVVPLFNFLFLPTMKSVQGGSSLGLVVATMHVVLYCVTVYGMANMSFKSIDLLPNQILRWVGGAIMHDLDGSASGSHAIERAGQTGGSALGEGGKGMQEGTKGFDKSMADVGSKGGPKTEDLIANADPKEFR